MSNIIAREDTIYSFFNCKLNKANYNNRNKIEQIYEIPCYQRGFSWEQRHYELLANDIYDAYIKKTSYYLGNIIYYKNYNEKNCYYIVDGQQRITSLILLLCAFRNKYPELNDNITKEFIINTKSSGKSKYKLKQNNYDNSIFQKIIAKSKDIKEENSILYKSYEYFTKYFDEKVIKYPVEYYNTIKNLIIVRIEIEGKRVSKIAQTVFEKLNSTGEPLRAYDLIRNYLLFTNNITQQNNDFKLWTKLEKIVNKNELDDFLKAYTILKTANQNKTIYNSDIYREFKNYAEKQLANTNNKLKGRQKILENLIYYAFYYNFICNYVMYTYDEDKNITVDELKINKTRENNLKKSIPVLRLLRIIGSTEFVPLLLQLFDITSKNKFNNLAEILELLLDFLIRYRITGISKGGGALTSATKKMIKGINNGSIEPNKDSIHRYLSNYHEEFTLFPTDNDFKNKLMSFDVDDNAAKVVLYQLERKYDGLMGVEFNPQNITLEHLMPQTIDPNKKEGKWWISNLGGKRIYMDVYKQYLNRIGNLAIITLKKNEYISNNQWDYKTEKLSKDRFHYTKEITNNEEWFRRWDKTSIEQRTEEITKTIVKSITGPVKSKK